MYFKKYYSGNKHIAAVKIADYKRRFSQKSHLFATFFRFRAWSSIFDN
jgi:hypothetical protein